LITNKSRLSLALFLLLLGSGLAWTSIAHAQSFVSQTAASQVVNSSLYSYGRNIDIEGTINGDVYCAGQNVTVDATVHGDVLCAGQTVTINGHVDGSVRVVAQDFIDGATVGRSFSVAAHTAVIAKNATVGSDVSFVGQTFSVNGHVGRDIAVRASTMNINGTVGRNVTYNGSRLAIWSKAHIIGALTYTSLQKAFIAKTAVVHGAVSKTVPTVKAQSARVALASWAGSFLYFFAAMLFFGLILVLLIPQTIRVVSDEPAEHLGKTLLNGLGFNILEPIILVVLLATVIGIPLAVVAILLFLTLGVCSVPITAYYVGTLVMSRSGNAILTMTVGMFIVVLLLLVPFIDIFAAIGCYFIGSGAVILALRKYLPTPIYKVK
jgi:cytoskeletal protein CcmA (bactofilin family)